VSRLSQNLRIELGYVTRSVSCLEAWLFLPITSNTHFKIFISQLSPSPLPVSQRAQSIWDSTQTRVTEMAAPKEQPVVPMANVESSLLMDEVPVEEPAGSSIIHLLTSLSGLDYLVLVVILLGTIVFLYKLWKDKKPAKQSGTTLTVM
jgi:hypothetical protein